MKDKYKSKYFEITYIEEWDIYTKKVLGRMSLLRPSGEWAHIALETNDAKQFHVAKNKMREMWESDNKVTS